MDGADKPANGVSPEQTKSETHERHRSNGEAMAPPPGKGLTSRQAAPSLVLPPRDCRTLERNGGGSVGNRRKEGAQPQAAGVRASPVLTPADADAEHEAMLRANLPSAFGAARDKPLGKKADRPRTFVRGGAGAAISLESTRFATGRKGSTEGAAGGAEGDAADKAKTRKQREAEIAAITAELARADSGDSGGRPDGEEERGEKGRDHFKPGGWRYSANAARGRDVAEGIMPKRNGVDGGTEEPLVEEEDEDEEEVTEEMHVRQVIRRLGLPVSHEVNLSGHSKGVTALALDRAGGRVATGSNDYKVIIYPSVLIVGGVRVKIVVFGNLEG